MTTNPEAISTDRVLRAMADQRRRTVLRHLMANGESTVTIDELARHVADGESPDGPHRDELDRIVNDLYHAHLPKLTELEVVEYDPHEGCVEYRSHGAVEDLLQVVSRFE